MLPFSADKHAMLINQALFRPTAIPAAVKSLDASVLRGKAIASNLANVMTPGYERIEVEFESVLRREMNRIKPDGSKTDWDPTSARAAFEKTEPVAYRPRDPTLPGGINNVDIDMEAAKLSENQIFFNYAVKFIQAEKGMIDSAISGEAM